MIKLLVIRILFVLDKVQEHFLDGDFCKGIDCLMASLRDTNAFMQFNKPWELVKKSDKESKEKLSTVLHVALEVLRISGILLQPVIPTLSNRLLTKLAVPLDQRTWQNFECFQSFNRKPNLLEGKPLGKDSMTFFERRK